MKVYIGKYPNRLICNIHTRYMDKKYGFANWKENTKFEDRLEWVENRIQDVYDVFNWAYFDRKKQKVDVRIDPWDSWSADYTLAHIILPLLVEIKLNKHGASFVDDEDVPEEIRSTNAPPKENDWDTDEFWFKRWDYVLDEMCWAFSEIVGDNGFERFITGDNDEDFDSEGYEAYQKRISNGLRLFGKYYQGLWT
jgi:hypothetical protein